MRLARKDSVGYPFTILMAICAAGLMPSISGAQRRVTVRDGIEMTTLANPWYVSGAPACDSPASVAPVASFSPGDGKFVVVLRRGDVARGVNRYAMLLWKTDRLGAEAPREILQMNSSSALPAIDAASIDWAEDGRSLMFLGERSRGHHELFKLDLSSGAVQAMTHHATDVMSYSRDADGGVIAYEAMPSNDSLWDASTERRGLVVTTESAAELIVGQKERFPVPRTERQLFVTDSHGTRLLQPLSGNFFLGDSLGRDNYNITISPNGRYLVVLESIDRSEIPKAWHEYSDWLVRYFFKLDELWNATPVSLFERYVLVDLRNGRSRVLLDAPVLMPRAAVWAPDSRSVVLSQVLPSIGRNPVNEREQWSGARRTVEVDIGTGALRQVGPQCFLAIRWQPDGLICQAAQDYVAAELKRYATGASLQKSNSSQATNCPARRTLRFRKSDGVWRNTHSLARSPVDIFLREDMNTPPRIYFRRSGGGGSKLLWNLNPQLKGLKFGRVEEVRWKGFEEQQYTAGLYYPPDYHPGRRYPLVIQTHGFNARRFEFFGISPTAFSAMPLAARNIFVLQIDDMRLSRGFEKLWQLHEVENAIESYKSAIAYLSGRGLIDPQRVGIIGYSHTCLYVKWALVHDPGLFAAASVTEGGDGGYVGFMLDLPNSVDVHSLYGGEPFGQELKTWIRLSPGFNLDRVRAPLLITVLHHRSVLADWEWFQGLKYLGKAVEMVTLDGRADDDHILQGPWDRQISSGGNVDWFDFWLNGHEDSTPRKRGQYARWHRLAALQQRVVRERALSSSSD